MRHKAKHKKVKPERVAPPRADSPLVRAPEPPAPKRILSTQLQRLVVPVDQDRFRAREAAVEAAAEVGAEAVAAEAVVTEEVAVEAVATEAVREGSAERAAVNSEEASNSAAVPGDAANSGETVSSEPDPNSEEAVNSADAPVMEDVWAQPELEPEELEERLRMVLEEGSLAALTPSEEAWDWSAARAGVHRVDEVVLSDELLAEPEAQPEELPESLLPDDIQRVAEDPYLAFDSSEAMDFMLPLSIRDRRVLANLHHMFEKVEESRDEAESEQRRLAVLYRRALKEEMNRIVPEVTSEDGRPAVGPRPVRVPEVEPSVAPTVEPEAEPVDVPGLPGIHRVSVSEAEPVEEPTELETEPAEPEPVEPESEPAESEPAETAEPEPAESEPAEPETVEPESEPAETAESETVEPESEPAEESKPQIGITEEEIIRLGRAKARTRIQRLQSAEEVLNEAIAEGNDTIDARRLGLTLVNSKKSIVSKIRPTKAPAPPESKPEPKAEPKPEAKPELKHEPKPEPRTKPPFAWKKLLHHAKDASQQAILLSRQLQIKEAAKDDLRRCVGELFGLTFLPAAVILLVSRLVLEGRVVSPVEQFLSYGLGHLAMLLLALLLPLVYVLRRRTFETSFLLGKRKPPPAVVLLSALVGLPLLLVLTGVQNVISYVLLSWNVPLPGDAWQMGPSMLIEMPETQTYLLVFLVYGLLEPLIEEVYFRGVLQNLMVRAGSVRAAIIAQAVAYALFKPQGLFWIFPFFLALFLGYLRYAMDSIWPVIAARLTVNIGTLAIYLLLPTLLTDGILVGTRTGQEILQASLVATVLGVLVLFPCLNLLGYFRKRRSAPGSVRGGSPFTWVFVAACVGFFVLKFLIH